MDTVIRAIAIYFFLLLIFRISGKRSIHQITTFDFVLLLIIGDSAQQALLGEDYSIIGAWILIVTLVGLDVAFSFLKQWSPRVDRLIDGAPLVLVNEGKVLPDRMRKCRVDVADILQSARELQGLESLEQIKYAVLERNGSITVIPKEQ